jgi:triphosphatase
LRAKSRAPINGCWWARCWRAQLSPPFNGAADRLPEALRAALGANGLRPIFTTTVRQRQHVLGIADALVEVAFDQGVIEAGDHRVPISEKLAMMGQ